MCCVLEKDERRRPHNWIRHASTHVQNGIYNNNERGQGMPAPPSPFPRSSPSSPTPWIISGEVYRILDNTAHRPSRLEQGCSSRARLPYFRIPSFSILSANAQAGISPWIREISSRFPQIPHPPFLLTAVFRAVPAARHVCCAVEKPRAVKVAHTDCSGTPTAVVVISRARSQQISGGLPPTTSRTQHTGNKNTAHSLHT
jgi:hypothetical protein